MSEETKETQEESSGSERANKMMDGVLKGLRDFGSVAKEKAEEFGKMASEKAEELTKLGKLKLDIHQLNRSRSKALAELGELVFNLQAENDLKALAKHENYESLIETVQNLDKEIAEKEAEASTVAHEEGLVEAAEKEE